jgi:hypothetical protein
MKNDYFAWLLFGPPFPYRFWATAVTSGVLLTVGWFLRLATDLLDQPGAEVLGGSLIVGLLVFSVVLAGQVLLGWKRLNWGERLLALLSPLMVISARVINRGPLW